MLNNPIRFHIKFHLRKAFYAQETGNTELYAECKEVIRALWAHRNSNKTVTAVM